MALQHLSREYFQKNSNADELLRKFEEQVDKIRPQMNLLEAKAIVFRDARKLYQLLSNRSEKPLDAVVYLGWIIDGLGAVPLGDERFLQIAAEKKNIVVIRKRE